MKISKKQNSQFKLLILGIALALLACGATAYGLVAKNNGLWPFMKESSSSADPSKVNDVNYDPPTQEEIKSSQDAKKNDSSSTTNSSQTNTTPSKKSVSVAISFADIVNDKLEIRAFISGVIEGNGTCSATVSKSGKVITKTSPAFIDATSSICEPMYVDKPELQSGDWQVVVSYDSPDAKGVSEKVTVSVR